MCGGGAIPHQINTDESLTILIPLTSYIDGHVSSTDALCHRPSSQFLPPLWMIVCIPPLTLCKLIAQQEEQASKADITNISISGNLEWTLHFRKQELTPTRCPLLREFPVKLTNVTAVVCRWPSWILPNSVQGTPNLFGLWRHQSVVVNIV